VHFFLKKLTTFLTLALPGDALTNFPCKLRLIFFTALGDAPPGYAYVCKNKDVIIISRTRSQKSSTTLFCRACCNAVISCARETVSRWSCCGVDRRNWSGYPRLTWYPHESAAAPLAPVDRCWQRNDLKRAYMSQADCAPLLAPVKYNKAFSFLKLSSTIQKKKMNLFSKRSDTGWPKNGTVFLVRLNLIKY